MHEYYTIAFIALLAAISPGPDFVVVVKHAVAHNRIEELESELSKGMNFKENNIE